MNTAELVSALRLRDLTDPAAGPHAVQLLLDDLVAADWRCPVSVQRPSPLVAVEDNYDRLGYAPDAVTRDARYSRYVGETVMLRSHTSAGVPPALRRLAADPVPDVLLVLPGLVHRRDVIDRLHVGAPHQVDLWRVTVSPVSLDDLEAMAALVVATVVPGARWRLTPASHPYTRDGRQIDVETPGGWVELGECGLIAPAVLDHAGLTSRGPRMGGLAMGIGLDRALMVRKGVDDIRLLRSADPRVAGQMLDLAPWRPVSRQPAVRRDLSIVVAGIPDAELLGDTVRGALGDDAESLESVEIVGVTPYDELPPVARERLGLGPDECNVLVRLTLRPPTGALTSAQANRLRDAVYAAVHRGPHREWATSA
ncbi:hypothetical protein [Cryptosporangium arvum]|uniref:PheS-related mystery ligase SrmL n=1 Tax=Cryptosporangium arvum TaxID=80871 RepID=UPI0004AF3175|nr:hypothetical protein [Cryptosporangium arvum]